MAFRPNVASFLNQRVGAGAVGAPESPGRMAVSAGRVFSANETPEQRVREVARRSRAECPGCRDSQLAPALVCVIAFPNV